MGTVKVAVKPLNLTPLNEPERDHISEASSDAMNRDQSDSNPNSDIVDIYLDQAQIYADTGEWEKAVRACKEALAISPESGNAYKMLGKLCQQQGHYAEAMGYYAKALSLQAHFPEVYSNLGSLYAQQEHWDKAVEYYQKAITQAPQFAPAYLNLSKVWKKLGKEENAQACLLDALRLKPDVGSAKEHYQIAKSLEADGNVEEAITFYRQSIQQTSSEDATTAATYQHLADLMEERGDWQAATDCYHKVLSINATRQSERSEAARRTVETSSAQSPLQALRARPSQLASRSDTHSSAPNTPTSSPSVPNLLGLSKADQSRIRRLMKSSKKKRLLQPAKVASTRLNPAGIPTTPPQLTHLDLQANRQRLLQQRSLSSLQTQQRQPSSQQQSQGHQSQTQLSQIQRKQRSSHPQAIIIGQLKQAIRKSPKSAVLYRNLAKAFASAHQKRHAAEAWFRAFRLEPDWPSAAQYLELGKALEAMQNTKAAAYCYGHAVRKQRSLQEAKLRLGQLAGKLNPKIENNQMLSGQTLSGQMLNVRPQGVPSSNVQNPRSRLVGSERDVGPERIAAANDSHRKGERLREAEDWASAIEAYKHAIELYPGFSWSYHSLGDCYKKIEHWAAAADAYRKAISLNSEFVWSYYSLAEVLEKQELWPAAAECYRRARSIEPDNEQVPPRLAGVLQKLIAAAPRNIELYKALAEQLLIQEKRDEAISTYQMALQIEPTDASIALALSNLLSDRDPHKAHMLLDRALAKTLQTTSAQTVLPQTQSEPSLQTSSANLRLSPYLQSPLATTPEASELQHTHLFDPIYYRAAHPSVVDEVNADDSQALLNHYLTKGSIAGCNPNPLFDDHFYRTRNPEVLRQRINPLIHYYQSGYKNGADPHPFFSSSFYIETHVDVAATDINPLEHYLAYGAQEGRVAFSAKPFKTLLDSTTPKTAPYTEPLWRAAKLAQTQQHIGVYCNSMGNYFITEIADFIAAALTQAGHQVMRLNEQDAIPDDLDTHWVIAPHEFFYLGEGSTWMKKQDWLSRSVMVNVEQPQTTWFSKAFHFLRHAKVIFDINVKSAAILQKLNLPAYWLPLGYLENYAPFKANVSLPNLRALGSLSPKLSQNLPALSDPLKDRPIDLHFIGTLNPRRECFFAQSAQWLNQHHTFLHIPPMGVPLLKGQDQALDTETVIGLSRRSKILLNIHRDELPYFEWHRIIFHGLWQKTLVVTEPCHDIPGLVADEHFIACDLEDMAHKLDWLLRTPEGQQLSERVRNAGHEALRTRFDGAQIMANAAQIAEQALSEALPGTSLGQSALHPVSGG